MNHPTTQSGDGKMHTATMHLSDNALDSLDVISRIDELESERNECIATGREFYPDMETELLDLLPLQECAERYINWIR